MTATRERGRRRGQPPLGGLTKQMVLLLYAMIANGAPNMGNSSLQIRTLLAFTGAQNHLNLYLRYSCAVQKPENRTIPMHRRWSHAC
jgi:hypothetical protein